MANEKRLIDANALMEGLKSLTGMFTDEMGFVVGLYAVLRKVDAAPTVDAVEVVHGRWEAYCGGLLRCSACGYEYLDYLECKDYCGNCGADMRERKNNER